MVFESDPMKPYGIQSLYYIANIYLKIVPVLDKNVGY